MESLGQAALPLEVVIITFWLGLLSDKMAPPFTFLT
jgi:hypothetical protein